jgi:hypothetical protein
MDFAQRSQQTAPSQVPVQGAGGSHSKRRRQGFAWLKWSSVVLLFCTTVLIVSLIISLVFGSTGNESKYVNTNQYQAVFLNNGQVYFGHIKTLNDKYTRIDNIYYLRQNTTVQPNQSTDANANSNFSLVKLGCEIHGPVDEMLVNHDQVTFWENLKTDGQVAKAIDAYIKQNPSGQKCDTTTSTPTATTPAATTPAKKQ